MSHPRNINFTPLMSNASESTKFAYSPALTIDPIIDLRKDIIEKYEAMNITNPFIKVLPPVDHVKRHRISHHMLNVQEQIDIFNKEGIECKIQPENKWYLFENEALPHIKTSPLFPHDRLATFQYAEDASDLVHVIVDTPAINYSLHKLSKIHKLHETSGMVINSLRGNDEFNKIDDMVYQNLMSYDNSNALLINKDGIIATEYNQNIVNEYTESEYIAIKQYSNYHKFYPLDKDDADDKKSQKEKPSIPISILNTDLSMFKGEELQQKLKAKFHAECWDGINRKQKQTVVYYANNMDFSHIQIFKNPGIIKRGQPKQLPPQMMRALPAMIDYQVMQNEYIHPGPILFVYNYNQWDIKNPRSNYKIQERISEYLWKPEEKAEEHPYFDINDPFALRRKYSFHPGKQELDLIDNELNHHNTDKRIQDGMDLFKEIATNPRYITAQDPGALIFLYIDFHQYYLYLTTITKRIADRMINGHRQVGPTTYIFTVSSKRTSNQRVASILQTTTLEISPANFYTTQYEENTFLTLKPSRSSKEPTNFNLSFSDGVLDLVVFHTASIEGPDDIIDHRTRDALAGAGPTNGYYARGLLRLTTKPTSERIKIETTICIGGIAQDNEIILEQEDMVFDSRLQQYQYVIFIEPGSSTEIQLKNKHMGVTRLCLYGATEGESEQAMVSINILSVEAKSEDTANLIWNKSDWNSFDNESYKSIMKTSMSKVQTNLSYMEINEWRGRRGNVSYTNGWEARAPGKTQEFIQNYYAFNKMTCMIYTIPPKKINQDYVSVYRDIEASHSFELPAHYDWETKRINYDQYDESHPFRSDNGDMSAAIERYQASLRWKYFTVNEYNNGDNISVILDSKEQEEKTDDEIIYID